MLVSVEVDYSDATRKTGKLKRCNAKVIEDASREMLKRALEESVEITATAITDGRKGYLPALSGRWRIIEESAQGLNFEALH